MSYYELMQMGASSIKPLIKKTEDAKLKKKYISALIVKNVLCILFCMLVVTTFTNIFGVNNSIVGVVTVVLLMSVRFVDLDFKTSQSTFAILGIFAIFIISPYVVTLVNPVLGFFINFTSMMAIIVLSCHNVMYCNQSTFILSYLLLYGYQVNSINEYINRVFGLILGGLLVAGIFYYKHRKIEFKNSFSDIIKDMDFSTPLTKWQLKLALGVSIAVLIGELLHLPRIMWIAFACNSILQPTEEKVTERVKFRYPFVIIGCLIFAAVYLVVPEAYRGYIGMLGGLMVGFSGTYNWQTSFNCFGALAVAVPMFGLGWAIVIRITDNIIAAIYSKLFNNIFNKIESRICRKETLSEIG